MRPPLKITWGPGIFLLVLHVPLALWMHRWPVLALPHALLCLGLGLWWALGAGSQVRVAYLGAYLASAEVLWRMTNNSTLLPWEFGKYALVLIFLTALLRQGRVQTGFLPMAYFVLLIPGAILTLLALNWARARDALSFNLSGPLALTLSVLFFMRLKLTGQQWLKLALVMMGPILGVAALGLSQVVGSSIAFGHSSNIEASGGFGPNQVSSALGFGIVVAFLCMTDWAAVARLKLVCFAALIIFTVESVLTLSRSGIYLGVLSGVAASWYLLWQRQGRVYLLAGGVGLALVLGFVVLPRVETFTKGATSARFKNTNVTRRDSIALADLKVFRDHPVLGVGVGAAGRERKQYYNHSTAAHMEYSRVLAEHGLFGAASLLMLVLMGLRNLRQARFPGRKAIVAALICYALFFMAVNGMRMVLPAFAFGLAAVGWTTATAGVPARNKFSWLRPWQVRMAQPASA